MYKIYKSAISQYAVRNSETGELIGVYASVRSASSVANLKNIQARNPA